MGGSKETKRQVKAADKPLMRAGHSSPDSADSGGISVAQMIGEIKTWWRGFRHDKSGEWRWWYRFAIILLFLSLASLVAGYIAYQVYWVHWEKDILPDGLKTNYVLISAVIISVFTLINGLGVWLIRTHDQKKQFRDIYKQQNEIIFSNACNVLFQDGKVHGNVFALGELFHLRDNDMVEPERIEKAILNANLSGANLAGMDLQNENLTGVNLSGANLKGTNLKHTDLSGANLSKSDLSGAIVLGTDLSYAILHDAKLQGVDFSQLDLSGAGMSHASAPNAKLANIKLPGIWWNNAGLSGSDLSGADLSGANLVAADFRDANLSNVNLCGADLQSANLSGTNLMDANLSDTNLIGTILIDVAFNHNTKFNGITCHPHELNSTDKINNEKLRKILKEQNTWEEKNPV